MNSKELSLIVKKIKNLNKNSILYHKKHGEGLFCDFDESKGIIYIKFSGKVRRFVISAFFNRDKKIRALSFNKYSPEEKRIITKEKDNSKKIETRPIFLENIKTNLPMQSSKPIFKESANDIEKILKERNIKNLIHFTHINNLISILTFGLIPRSMHNSLEIKSVYNDTERRDGKFDHTSLSVEFPNYKLLYKNRLEKGYSDYVIITLSSDLLLEYECKYFSYNAASQKYTLDNNDNFYSLFYNNQKREQLMIPNNFPTNPQAEILVKGIIKPNFIKCIYFHDNEVLKYFCKNCSRDILFNYDFSFDNHLFQPRCDYEHWKGVGYNS